MEIPLYNQDKVTENSNLFDFYRHYITKFSKSQQKLSGGKNMFKCKKCGAVFNSCDTFMERYYPTVLPVSGHKHCPECKSDRVGLYEGKFCACCGIRIEEWQEYCSPDCERLAKILKEREEKRKKLVRSFELSLAVREVEDYNRTHGTRLSYGEYFAKKGQGLLQ